MPNDDLGSNLFRDAIREIQGIVATVATTQDAYSRVVDVAYDPKITQALLLTASPLRFDSLQYLLEQKEEQLRIIAKKNQEIQELKQRVRCLENDLELMRMKKVLHGLSCMIGEVSNGTSPLQA